LYFISADELLMTELMFNGVFNDLSVPQTVALLSCFVCDEKSNEMPAKTAELAGPLRKMQVNYYFINTVMTFFS
jgi:ATP-dependent RNA helicase DOB1